MKKIVFVTRSMFAGGAERVIAQLAKYFSIEQIKCYIITLDDDKVLYELPVDTQIIPIGVKSRFQYLDKIKKYLAIRKQIKEIDPDIVLSMPEDVGIYVIPSLFGTGIPVVVSERNNPWRMPWHRVTRILRKIFYRYASGFIFQTEEAASFFSSKIKDKSIVIPNPLDLDRLPLQWSGERRKEIVGAGRLDEQKNFILLVAAFAEFQKIHTDYRLVIYGEGSLREELETRANAVLPQGTYEFPGRTTDLLNKINGASMFVLSSDYEGMPNVLIEAMAIGLPCISTNCKCGPTDLIVDGYNGLLVPTGDKNALAAAMKIITESKVLMENLSHNSIAIRGKLDAKIVVNEWLCFLQKCVK